MTKNRSPLRGSARPSSPSPKPPEEAENGGVRIPLFEALVEVLRILLAGTRPADRVLHDFFRDQSQLGGRDRAWVTDHFYGLLRHWESLTVLAPATAPRRLVLASLQRVGGRSARELQGLCRGDEERDWLAALAAQRLPDTPSVRAHLPEWVVSAVQEVLPEGEWLALGWALQKPAPLDLRVNLLKADRPAVLAALTAAGIAAEATPLSPWGVRVQGRPLLNRLPLFTEGWVEIQDEGSQLLAALVAPRRRDMVVDFCAGSGGKALHLAALMHNQGRLYAFDVAARRLEQLKPRLKRSGVSNLMPVVIARETDDRVRRLTGKIDRVLVDAPCSGMGTLRRNPDLKLRQTADGLSTLVDKQRHILEAAAQLVKPGGRLVYATCSLLPAENQIQALEFTARHPEFVPLAASQVLAEQGIIVSGLEDPWFQLWPQRHGTDGFFAALWQRQG
ncbi:RsmB/NOP family class I SAM-dependent RNA methyltransferase [Ferrovum sp.]|uniref:RsmB/NOP family class I SAM-dependent RNA methyltransferase n=1 Tax=Ferrovum sp. TaxID=2609467 RepID=UPI0026051777|nr:RsmB/NOP family class I SAM-dependent RNA methyltransferase [Ferrovum sp.]